MKYILVSDCIYKHNIDVNIFYFYIINVKKEFDTDEKLKILQKLFMYTTAKFSDCLKKSSLIHIKLNSIFFYFIKLITFTNILTHILEGH